MKQVIKREGILVKAYCLGTAHSELDKLMNEGLLRQVDSSNWLVFSREATSGEKAKTGDYIKVDSKGMPYPNSKEFFQENHIIKGGDLYEQIPKPLWAWHFEDGMCPEVEFLIEKKGLEIDQKSEDSFFKALLWGDVLTAAKDAAIVFYALEYSLDGSVIDASFNFVAKDEFEKTYREFVPAEE